MKSVSQVRAIRLVFGSLDVDFDDCHGDQVRKNVFTKCGFEAGFLALFNSDITIAVHINASGTCLVRERLKIRPQDVQQSSADPVRERRGAAHEVWLPVRVVRPWETVVARACGLGRGRMHVCSSSTLFFDNLCFAITSQGQ